MEVSGESRGAKRDLEEDVELDVDSLRILKNDQKNVNIDILTKNELNGIKFLQ